MSPIDSRSRCVSQTQRSWYAAAANCRIHRNCLPSRQTLFQRKSGADCLSDFAVVNVLAALTRPTGRVNQHQSLAAACSGVGTLLASLAALTGELQRYDTFNDRTPNHTRVHEGNRIEKAARTRINSRLSAEEKPDE